VPQVSSDLRSGDTDWAAKPDLQSPLRQRVGELRFGLEKRAEAGEIEIGNTVAGILDARRERLGGIAQRGLRRPLHIDGQRTHDEVGINRARLRHGDDARAELPLRWRRRRACACAFTFGDDHGFAVRIQLRAQRCREEVGT
jgi:hypothetical protein